MLNSGLCDYSDTYILVKRTTTVAGKRVDAGVIAGDRNHKQVTTKKYATFTD